MTPKVSKPLQILNDYYLKKAYEQAVLYAQEALPKIKNREIKFQFLSLLGACHHKLENYKEATSVWLNALKIRKDKEICDHILRTYLFNLKDLENGEEFAKRATSYFPKDSSFYEILANFYQKEGENEKALYYFLEVKRWDFVSISGRECAVWDIVHETDALLLNTVRKKNFDKLSLNFVFTCMNVPSFTPHDMLNMTKNIIENHYEKQLKLPECAPEPLKEGKIKIGYISADFYDHATMILFMRVLELHNSDEFEFHLLYLQEEKDSNYKSRIDALNFKKHFLHDMNAKEAAEHIAKENFHILVDLKGYTKDSRPEIIAQKPAKIIVNWLGYPASMAVPRMADYIIGDPIVTPLESAGNFSETLALMPYCYQPNDNTLVRSNSFTRKDFLLPEDKVVFCSFNQIIKLNPEQFSFWCLLLKNLPNTVLWILRPSSEFICRNILKEAEARGVEMERIIFAPPVTPPNHRARLHLADIALDSFPCTSHTTASDALRAGVPLIAQYGTTFTARVSSSIVTAHNCPELVAYNIQDAYSIAQVLATEPEVLQTVRNRVKENFATAPLFNTLMFTRDLERMYKKIWSQYQKGIKEPIVLEPQNIKDDTKEFLENIAKG